MKAQVGVIPIFAVAAILLLLGGCRAPTSKYLPVVSSIASGTTKVPANGVVGLAPTWPGLTPRDVAYAERRPDGRLFILFPTWYGRGQDIEGWLHCSGPLGPADFHNVNWGGTNNQAALDAAGYDLLTVESQSPPWYRVTRRLD
jgi:hypothetical protein